MWSAAGLLLPPACSAHIVSVMPCLFFFCVDQCVSPVESWHSLCCGRLRMFPSLIFHPQHSRAPRHLILCFIFHALSKLNDGPVNSKWLRAAAVPPPLLGLNPLNLLMGRPVPVW